MSEKPFLRVRTHLGATAQVGPGDSWRKGEWSIEADVPTGMDADQALDELERKLEQRQAKFLANLASTPSASHMPTATSPPTFSSPRQQEATPELSPAYLDRLPWNIEPWGAWIFRDTQGAEALSEELAKSPQPLAIGNNQYRISKGRPDSQGRQREFINRFPAEAAKK